MQVDSGISINKNKTSVNGRSFSLSESQEEAVSHKEGPFLVLAGAGSGKTRVLTQRIVHLMSSERVSPHNILAVTFTNKAAKEMKSRVEISVGKEKSRDLWIGTFHGICNRILRLEIKKYNDKYSKSFVILDADESVQLVKDSIESLNLDNKIYVAKKLQQRISELKNNGILPPEYEKQVRDFDERRVFEIYSKYQEKLEQSNSLDFDDLLLITVRLLSSNEELREYYRNRFEHVLVDEFQDTNKIQYELLRKLIFVDEKNFHRDWTGRSFCAVGDIDQSIYSWRGADYKIALNFQKDFPESKLIKLEENFRSSGFILQVANSIITNNRQRIEKTLRCTKGNGKKVILFEAKDEIDEGRFINSEIRRLTVTENTHKLKDIAILYRTNAQSRSLEESFVKAGLPYRIVGGMKFYDRLEIKDLLAYLRLISNPEDSISLKRVINSPRRGIGASTISQIEERADEMGVSLYSALSDLLDSGNLSPKTAKSIHDFVNLIESLRRKTSELVVTELLKEVIDKTGYVSALEKEATEESQNRIENIEELLNVADEFIENDDSEDKSLEAFLSQVSLVGDIDQLDDNDESNNNDKEKNIDKITLMTVHSSKGLEFPCVFISGLEEGIFPHIRSINVRRDDAMEEERRLAYVAVTRAEEKLYLTYARNRRLWGTREFSERSRFLNEIPCELLSNHFGESFLNKNASDALKDLDRRGATINISTDRISSGNTEDKYLLTSPNPSLNGRENKKEQEIIEFDTGEKVFHSSFGEGVIVGSLGGKNKKFYAVEFSTGKKILAPESLLKR